MKLPEPVAAVIAQGGLLVLLTLFGIACLLAWLVLERSRSLGLELLDLVPRLRKKKRAARSRLREALANFLGEPSRENRISLRQASEDLQSPLARFGGRLASELVVDDRRLARLEVEEAMLLAELETERGLPLLQTLSRAALLLGLLASFRGLLGMFHSMWYNSPRDPGAMNPGLFPSLTLVLLALTVSLVGAACAGVLARRAAFEGGDVRMACERIPGLSREVDR